MEKDAPEKKFRSFVPAVCVSLFACFSLLFYGPLDMYSDNAADLWFSLRQLLGNLVLASLAAFAASLVGLYVLRLVSVRLYRGTLALYFGVTLAAYLQGTFFNIGAASLEDGSVAWITRLFPMLANLALWAGIILLPIALLAFLPKRFGSAVQFVSLGLVIMQIASMFTLFGNVPMTKSSLYMSTEGRFDLSADENIIVLIADSVGTDYMGELMKKNPEALDFLDGFTYYPNTVGAYRKTAGAYTYLMTGQYYLNQKPFTEYCKEAFTNDTFWKELKALGYAIHIGEVGSGVPYIKDQMDVFSNLVDAPVAITSRLGLMKTMMKMVGYRFGPVVMQPFLLQDFVDSFNSLMGTAPGQPRQAEKNDVPFYSALTKQKLSAQEGEKSFHLYFLQGANEPYRMDENGKAVADNSEGYYPQLLGTFRIFKEYITQLKGLGLYDNSTIIIMADHAQTYDLPPKNPMFMVKPKNASGALATSLAPISYEDFRPTLMKAAGGDYAKYGTPVDAWKEGDARERKYYVYASTKAEKYDYYFSDIYELIVNGDVRDLAAYRPSGKDYTQEGLKSGKPYR